jgi:hypothetical protein
VAGTGDRRKRQPGAAVALPERLENAEPTAFAPANPLLGNARQPLLQFRRRRRVPGTMASRITLSTYAAKCNGTRYGSCQRRSSAAAAPLDDNGDKPGAIAVITVVVVVNVFVDSLIGGCYLAGSVWDAFSIGIDPACVLVNLHNKSHNKYAQKCPLLPHFEIEKPLKQKTFS